MPSPTNIPGVHFDGDFEKPLACGPVITSRPFLRKGDPFSRVWKQQFQVRMPAYLVARTARSGRLKFAGSDLNDPGPLGGLLVDESDPEDAGGAGIVTFWRTWAHVPFPRNEFESFAYSVQYINEDQTGIDELVKVIPSRVAYEYFYAPGLSASKIPIITAPKLAMVGGQICVIGGAQAWPPAPNSYGEIPAEDSAVRTWMGNIYERATRYIRFPSATQLYA